MPRTVSARPRRARTPVVASAPAAVQLTQPEAAQIMWIYYRDHKPQLLEGIRDCREIILDALMQGIPVEQVFAPYFRPPAGAQPLRRGGAAVRRSA